MAIAALDMANMSREELVEALQNEKEKNEKQIVVKVSPKGCVQVNGIRKFPINFPIFMQNNRRFLDTEWIDVKV